MIFEPSQQPLVNEMDKTVNFDNSRVDALHIFGHRAGLAYQHASVPIVAAAANLSDFPGVSLTGKQVWQFRMMMQ